jgi:hypothetical protein
MSKERELLKKILATRWLDHELSCEAEAILAQPEQDNIQYLLDQVSRLFAENAMLKEKWSTPKPESEQQPEAWMLIDKETGARIPRAYKPEHGVNQDRWELYPLYTTPPKREPLNAATTNYYLERLGSNFKWDDGFEAGVKWAEEQHGIGGEE